ncbi:MAG: translational GTPase TypA [Ruminococcaceae bacterium]|nr:translational GTPase TypA [Oscillospiraceae bacterium]
MERQNIRNIAIIAHVDHGKTTLVDAMLRQSGTFRENEQVAERVMDSDAIERERGITILAKNTALFYKDIKINIIDTPGHADFGGEVERGLKMADGVLLLVDAFEGCMPQTRFVLKKALGLNLRPIVVINKADRPNARPQAVADEVLDLLIDLGADDDQLEAPFLYASGRDGWASTDPEVPGTDLKVLFDLILDTIPAPEGDDDGPLQMLISNIDYDNYTGRIAIGRIQRGSVALGDSVSVCCLGQEGVRRARVNTLYTYAGLQKADAEVVTTGDIAAISGIADINIGETVCAGDTPEPLPFVEIDRPVLSMTFSVNDSPFAGKEGTYVTSRHLRARLYKELESNISLTVEDTDTTEAFIVSGRGELHLSVLIENMRRQGYEFQVSGPKVITKTIDGVLHEPIEYLMIDVPDEYTGAVIESAGLRKATLINMAPGAQGYTRIEFKIPARGLLGYRSQLLTETRGTCVMNHVFDSFEPYRGDLPTRTRGSLVAFEDGEAVSYGLFNAQDRGTMFISPGTKVYQGMIVGENSRADDIVVNVCKRKHVTNMRASGSDEALRLVPPRNMSLEQYIEFLADDELLEVTPQSLRIRKRILDNSMRAKKNSNK